ncbi:hypothetical protein [Amycolatopsis sp. NPDC003676]
MTVQPGAGPALGDDLSSRLRVLRAARGPAIPDFRERVQELIVVASSSRGGSSMVAETLRACRSLIHLRAEINPFLRLAGLASAGDSDQLTAADFWSLSDQERADLADGLALDAGCASSAVESDERFALDVAWRFVVQWPELAVDPLLVARTAAAELAACRAPDGGHDDARFQLRLLDALARQGVTVNPHFYDLPRAALRGRGFPVPSGAPGGQLIEEPPFVLTKPWHWADAADVSAKPLVIKTPSNAYRMGFLRALFPQARIRVLHIVRNPGAAINGLYDGWRYGGFHAHRMSPPLRIGGYDDSEWWKFDLPPGWRDYTAAPLLRVCGFQWLSAHRAVLADAAANRRDRLVVRFEDLIRGPHSRVAAFERIAGWLGVPFDTEFQRTVTAGIEPVVATAPPGPNRWRAREEAITQAMGADVMAMAHQLDYLDVGSWI